VIGDITWSEAWSAMSGVDQLLFVLVALALVSALACVGVFVFLIAATIWSRAVLIWDHWRD
jgi:hypothetical protein